MKNLNVLYFNKTPKFNLDTLPLTKFKNLKEITIETTDIENVLHEVRQQLKKKKIDKLTI